MASKRRNMFHKNKTQETTEKDHSSDMNYDQDSLMVAISRNELKARDDRPCVSERDRLNKIKGVNDMMEEATHHWYFLTCYNPQQYWRHSGSQSWGQNLFHLRGRAEGMGNGCQSISEFPLSGELRTCSPLLEMPSPDSALGVYSTRKQVQRKINA
ncbi:hypothetical protein AAG570_005208 [Ranatra chinensis]|uniref:Uncharacterized protein n=1 Tax=Ranatra chinensis TaxID=642074 RepID=A0ABD0XZS9_9HEMI